MIDLLFVSKDRLEFTKACMENLVRNTNFSEVGNLFIYDDHSTDGTRQWLRDFKGYPITPQFRFDKYGSPVEVMCRFLKNDSEHPIFAKIDNDTMVPEFWLEECLRVMHRHPGLDLLGIEAFRPVAARAEFRSFDSAEFIGGIGLMRRRAFFEKAASFPIAHGRQGFTQWQQRNPSVEKGWLNPALPVFLLDWIPREPWLSLNRDYITKEWARDWNEIFPKLCPYPEERRDLWRWYCK